MDLAKLSRAAFALLIACGAASVAQAAPPTVTPSPGYDARLQEQHAASTVYAPTTRAPVHVSRRRIKRWH